MIGVYFGAVVPILMKESYSNEDHISVNQKTTEIMIFSGVVDSLAGYYAGKFSANFGKKFAFFTATCIGVFAIFFTYLVFYSYVFFLIYNKK